MIAHGAELRSLANYLLPVSSLTSMGVLASAFTATSLGARLHKTHAKEK